MPLALSKWNSAGEKLGRSSHLHNCNETKGDKESGVLDDKMDYC